MSKPYDSPTEVEKWDVVRGSLDLVRAEVWYLLVITPSCTV